MRVRPAAVAGLFYPGDAGVLLQTIDGFLGHAPQGDGVPKILVEPHAGYVYSGQCAAFGYRQLEKSGFNRVLLMGPSHRVGFEGAAFSPDDAWQTPLGPVMIDQAAIGRFMQRAPEGFLVHPQPHAQEHALEVQLPFLQRVLGEFTLIPVTYGLCEPRLLVSLLEALLDEQTVAVFSSDLSHYYSQTKAHALDSECHRGVLALNAADLGGCEACGKTGIEAAIAYAKRHRLTPRLLDYRTSGDATGEHEQVVGYACYGFYKEAL